MKYTSFKLKMRTIAAVFAMFVLATTTYGQRISISGVVKDAANGEPIIGANILEKGTTNGTITNFNGEFALTVSSNAVLIIKYVGYQDQEISVAGKRNLVVLMNEDAIALGEVIAIGYATVRKNDATGSVTAIKPESMNKGLTTNAQDMMIGKIAGVSVTTDGGAPGAGAKIRIRGGSSLNASNDPLIVIDGLAMDNDGIKGVSNLLSTINPNDIESFTVLKDASATAIYGSRASNGVIIITTKKGDKKGKLSISYNGNVSVSQVGKTVDVLSGDEFRNYVNQLYTDQPAVIAKLGTANTDWQSQIYQTALSTDHSVSVGGGMFNVPYRVSVGYTGQDGILKTTNFKRVTGSLNLSPTFFDDHLKVNLNAKGMFVRTRYADTGAIGAAVAMDPTQPVMDSAEPFASKFDGYWQWWQNDSKLGITINPQATKNPLATLMQKTDIANATDFIGSAEFDYKLHFFPDVRLHLNLGTEQSSGKQEYKTPTTAGTDHVYGRTGWEVINKSNNSLSLYAQYAKEFGNNNFDILGGYEWQHFYRKGESEHRGLVRVDSNNNIVTDESFDFYNHILPADTRWATESYLISFFGRLNYSFMSKYLFTATVRNDASSRFAKKNRWGLFPSFAFAWKINEEGAIKDIDQISDLKLRLGYGVTGQQNLLQGDYPYIPVYTLNQDGAFYQFGNQYVNTYRPDAYNPKLKWEETTTYNGGIDFGFFKSRVNGSFDIYQRDTKDLINVVQIPAGTNFRNKVVSNIGNMTNKGFEFTLNARPVVKKDLSWEIGYNLTYNRNKITKLTLGSQEGYYVPTGGLFQGSAQAHAVGFPANSFYVYEQVYNQDKKPIEGLFVDRNGDGIINENDKYFYHNPNADYLMGFSSKLIIKKFDIGFNLRSSIGNYVYNAVDAERANVGSSGVWSSLGFFSNKPQSAFETNFSGRSTLQYLSDYFVQNASFLRCDNITIGYSFSKMFDVISGGRIYLAVQNPFIITKYKGLDPEVFGGIDSNLYPRPFVTMLGLNFNLY